jgi:predicted nucleotidyltransferase
MDFKLSFPTPQHQQVAEIAGEFFAARPEVDTVLVVNSCARGQATPESDLDMAILVSPATSAQAMRDLEAQWLAYASAHEHVSAFKQHSRFSAVHLDVIDGRYEPAEWDDGGGPDYFEISVGNHIVYSAPLGAAGPYLQQLRSQWLPYYDEGPRQRRLAMVRDACAYDLDFVPFYQQRGLHFQAFDRLYKAFHEFLQALFIARRAYPIAYNKWIREQVVNWLGLPELYPVLPPILSVPDIESPALSDKVHALRGLLTAWAV